MLDISNLLKDLDNLRIKYEAKREKEPLNFFSTVFKNDEEVKLHSRFISYLLAPDSSHKMGDTFAKIFVREILNLDENDFDLSNYVVYPNEKYKSEYNEIDILLVNAKKSQAIIIENKINGRDVTYGEHVPLEYRGQLDRYYHTIKNGKGFNKIDKYLKYKCDKIKVYYLSNNKPPEDDTIRIIKDIPECWNENHVLSYSTHLIEWLKQCKDATPNSNFDLIKIITDYLSIVKIMTNNDLSINERRELKEKVGENLDATRFLLNNFKHVKWHTVYDFWVEFDKQLDKTIFTDFAFIVDSTRVKVNDTKFLSAITKVTHDRKKIKHGISFKFKKNNIRIDLYHYQNLICELNGKNLKDHDNIFSNISFTEFESMETFSLINKNNMKKIVNEIVKKIIEYTAPLENLKY